MRKIKIGYHTTILASDEVLSNLARLLMETTDEKGEPIAFNIEASEDPAIARQRAENEAAVKKEMEAQEKSWLAQYQRAEKAEVELRQLRAKLLSDQESQA